MRSSNAGSRTAKQIAATAGNLCVRALPFMPDVLKRGVIGRRTTTLDGNSLDPTLQILLAIRSALGVEGLTDGDQPAIIRETFRRMLLQLNRRPVTVRQVNDAVIPGPYGQIPVRHYWPKHAHPTPLMVYYHGGGLLFGDLDTHDRLCRLICRDAEIHILAVDYRLAPEHPAPASLRDAYAAYQWALSHSEELGAEPGRVCVGGDSAGGTLAAVVAHQARDAGVSPELQLLLYPNTHWGANFPSRTLFETGFVVTEKDIELVLRYSLDNSGTGITDPEISPLLSDNFAGLAPAIVATGGFDPLRDEGEAYAAAMTAAGNVVDVRRFDSLVHGFAQFDALGGGCARAVAEINSAIKAHLSRH
jgi:acetyl esterase